MRPNYYAIDRFEEDVAVLVDDDEHTFTTARSGLPAGVREGDVLCREGEAYRLDEAETTARRERIRRLEEKLRKK